MRNHLTSLVIVLAVVLASSVVVSAQTEEGQAGQQPAANRRPRPGARRSKCPISHGEFAVRSARFFRNMDGARRSV